MKNRALVLPIAANPAGHSRCPSHLACAIALVARAFLATAAGLAISASAFSQAQSQDLSKLTVEDLMNVEVTSASKKEQKLSEVAAAIFVITQEDIRRSGATNIPDVLRIVPGLDVAQISASTWAISARGFNLEFANKLLVLIDGRAVYTPLFGGVYWDTQDVPLEDIDRIEVIRGPGGTVWGANAVNGVINIITRKASDTKGVLLTAGGGSHFQAFGTVQYGGAVGANTSYRVFAKYLNYNQFPDPFGQDGRDDGHLLHSGFRVDTSASPKDSLTTQGDIYTGEDGAIIVHSVFNPPNDINVQHIADLSGGNVLSRWDHVFSPRSDTTVQFYFDRYERDGPESAQSRDTLDFDFQHHIALGSRNDLIWGAGYRHTQDQTLGTIDQAFVPPNNAAQFFNSFLQDQIALKPDRVALYLGSKFGNSFFSGFDVEPSARLAWTPDNRRTFWAAVSRAGRTPTRRDVGINAALAALPGPAEVALIGNPNIQSEHVIAYEVGYRSQPTERFSIDLSFFFNSYYGLASIEPLPPFVDNTFTPPLTVLPRSLSNKMRGSTEGAEASVKWKITNRWTLSPGYSFLEMHLHTTSSSLDTVSVANTQGSDPEHQAQLRSRVELPRRFAWDTSVYYVGRLPAQLVPSYTRIDTRLVWPFAEYGELSIVGQNLLRDHHLEFSDFLQSVNSSQVKRGGYIKLTWRF